MAQMTKQQIDQRLKDLKDACDGMDGTATNEQKHAVIDMEGDMIKGYRPMVDYVEPKDVAVVEPTMVVVLIDDSGSMGGLESEVLKAAESVADALKGSKRRDEIIYMVGYLNEGTVIAPTTLNKLGNTPSYTVKGLTPLYDVVNDCFLHGLRHAGAFAAENRSMAYRMLIVTDGQDNDSKRATASSVADVIKQLKGLNGRPSQFKDFQVCAIDIDGGARASLLSMGIDSANILPVGSDAKSIRHAIEMFSKSVVDNTEFSAYAANLPG